MHILIQPGSLLYRCLHAMASGIGGRRRRGNCGSSGSRAVRAACSPARGAPARSKRVSQAAMAANHPRYAQQRERRRAERAELGGGKRRRVSRRAVSGVELLNTRLFGMGPSQLLTAPTVSAAPARFRTVAQYYACMQELVIEESRAIVAEGLAQIEGRAYTLEIDAQDNSSTGGSPRSKQKQGALESVRVRVEQISENDMPRLRDSCRAGGIWLLSTTGKPAVVRDSRGRGRRGGTSVARHRDGSGDRGSKFGGRGGCQALAERYTKGNGRLVGIDGREGLTGGRFFTLEMPAASAAAVRLAAEADGGCVAAWSVGSLLAQQRMCDVCQRAPSPAYMHQILGDKTCEHIKFGSSSSEEDENELEIDPPVEGEGLKLDGIIEAAWRDLNLPQRSAAAEFAEITSGFKNHANPSALQLLHGPPGTGKTTTVVALLQALHCNKNGSPRTLVCAPSNRGVAELLTRFLLSATPRDASLSVALVGDGARLFNATETMGIGATELPVSQEEDAEPVPGPIERRSVREDCYVYTFAETMHHQLSRLVNEAEQLSCSKTSSAAVVTNVAYRPRLTSATENAPRIQLFATRLAATIASCRRRMKRSASEFYKTELRTDFREATAAALALFGGNDEEGDGVDVEKMQEVQDDAKCPHDMWSETQLLNVIKALRGLLGTLGSFLPLGPRHMELVQALLSSADLVFCTLCVAGSHVVRTMKSVEVLVVDEAAQAIEPEVLIPLSLSPKRVLLAGDPQQLGATICSQGAQMAGLGRPLLARLMVDCQRPASLLSVQYRMHPEISSFPNAQFYGGKLCDAPCVLEAAAPWCSKDSVGWLGPCAFIDIGCKDGGNESQDASGSRCSPAEATVVAWLVTHLQERWGVHVADPAQLRVLTFYSAQVRSIKSALLKSTQLQNTATSGRAGGGVSVQTVDGSQGAESDVIVLSFVRSNVHGRIGFVSEPRRLNVALTRGRKSLVMVGDAATLSKDNNDVGALLSDLTRRKLIFPVSALGMWADRMSS